MNVSEQQKKAEKKISEYPLDQQTSNRESFYCKEKGRSPDL